MVTQDFINGGRVVVTIDIFKTRAVVVLSAIIIQAAQNATDNIVQIIAIGVSRYVEILAIL